MWGVRYGRSFDDKSQPRRGAMSRYPARGTPCPSRGIKCRTCSSDIRSRITSMSLCGSSAPPCGSRTSPLQLGLLPEPALAPLMEAQPCHSEASRDEDAGASPHEPVRPRRPLLLPSTGTCRVVGRPGGRTGVVPSRVVSRSAVTHRRVMRRAVSRVLRGHDSASGDEWQADAQHSGECSPCLADRG